MPNADPCTLVQSTHALRLLLWYFVGMSIILMSFALIFSLLRERGRIRSETKYEEFAGESDKYFRINPLTRR